jgi:hypothetical protein
MRVLHLALITALIAPTAAHAQSAAQQMLDMAKQVRASAALAGLTAEDRAQMIQQAEEIEQAVRDGAYAGAPAPQKEAPLSDRIAAAHNGRLEWLAAEAACAGYTQENYLSFRYSAAINDRDAHCRNAYGHWATYLRLVRNGQNGEEAEKALYYYDAAAQRAVALHGGK